MESEARRQGSQAQGHPAGSGRQRESGPPASNFPGSRNSPTGRRPPSPVLPAAPGVRRVWDPPQSWPLGAPARAEGGFSRTSDPGPVTPPRRLQRPVVPRTCRSGRKCHSLNSFPPGTAPGAGRAGSPPSRYADLGRHSLARGRRPGHREWTPGRTGCADRTHQVVHRVGSAWGPGSPQGAQRTARAARSRIPESPEAARVLVRPLQPPRRPLPLPPPPSRYRAGPISPHPPPPPRPAGPARLPACPVARAHWPLGLPMQMSRRLGGAAGCGSARARAAQWDRPPPPTLAPALGSRRLPDTRDIAFSPHAHPCPPPWARTRPSSKA